MVFQQYALFPHMSVYDNVAFGLSVKRVPRTEHRPRIEELLRVVSLEGYEQRKPRQLSGGQQQRVALSRAPSSTVPRRSCSTSRSARSK